MTNAVHGALNKIIISSYDDTNYERGISYANHVHFKSNLGNYLGQPFIVGCDKDTDGCKTKTEAMDPNTFEWTILEDYHLDSNG